MRRRSARLEFAAVLGLLAVACGEAVLDSEVGAATGALGLRCKQSDVELRDVEYVILRAGDVYRSGSILAGDEAGSFNAMIGPLSARTDYVIEVTGTAFRVWNRESTSCTGSAPFAVLAGQITDVSVTLRCLGQPAHGGREHNECPVVNSVRATPSIAAVGDTIVLETDAHDRDGSGTPLQYAWTAAAGALTDTTHPRAEFRCETAGKTSITLRVSDRDVSCPPETVTVQVKCTQDEPSSSCGCSKGKTNHAAGR